MSEYVRTNRVALIGSEQPAVRAFARKDVEVIEPEIHHLFVELLFAVNRAVHLGHGQLGDHALRRLHLFEIRQSISSGIAGAVLLGYVLRTG